MPRISIHQIEINLIGYFTRIFPHDLGRIFPGTNVRRRYHYSNEAWGDLADELSREQWMIDLNVVLIQNDMRGLSTIAQLAQKIASLIPRVAAPGTRATVTPMSTSTRSNEHLETTSSSTPTAKKARRKKKAAKKASKKKSKKKANKKKTKKRARKNS